MILRILETWYKVRYKIADRDAKYYEELIGEKSYHSEERKQKAWDKYSNVEWKRRKRTHLRYQKVYGWIIKRMALHLLKKSSYLCGSEIAHHLRRLEIFEFRKDNGGRLFDTYTYCHDRLKDICPSKATRWKATFGAFSVYGDSETDLYLEMIKMIIATPTRFPFCR